MTYSKKAAIRTAIAVIATLLMTGCISGDHGVQRMAGAGFGGVAGACPDPTAGSGKPGIAATMAGTMAGLFPDSGIGAALDKLYAARTWQAARPRTGTIPIPATRGDSANPHLQIDRLNLLRGIRAHHDRRRAHRESSRHSAWPQPNGVWRVSN